MLLELFELEPPSDFGLEAAGLSAAGLSEDDVELLFDELEDDEDEDFSASIAFLRDSEG